MKVHSRPLKVEIWQNVPNSSSSYWLFPVWNHIQQVSSADGVSSKLVSGPWVLLNDYFQGEEWNFMLLIHLYVPVHAEMGSSPQCPWIEISLCKTKKWWHGWMSFLRLHFVYQDVYATAFKWLNQQELFTLKQKLWQHCPAAFPR